MGRRNASDYRGDCGDDFSAVRKGDDDGTGQKTDAEIAIEIRGKKAHCVIFRGTVPRGYPVRNCNLLNTMVVNGSAD